MMKNNFDETCLLTEECNYAIGTNATLTIICKFCGYKKKENTKCDNCGKK